MSKFQVGDKVRVICAGGGVNPEGIGKITIITEIGGLYGIKGESKDSRNSKNQT